MSLQILNGFAELNISDANEDGNRMGTYVDVERNEEGLE